MNEVKDLAARIKGLGINALVLDTERFAPCLDLGCLPEMSRLMGAAYYTIEKLRARDLVSRIGAAWGD